MPKKGKKGKRKGKGKKKGKKKEKTVPHPPPLHLLTELYNLLRVKLRHLNEMRIMARKKRLEAWFMTRELSDLKGDNQIYKDYLNDNIDDLMELIAKIREQIERQRAEMQKEIDRLMAELNRRHEKILLATAEFEEQLAKAKADLMEFEPLMAKLAKMLARLEQLKKEIEAAELEADIKTRHLKNQFLMERAKLHNHLEKQLYDLIENCRSYIMPILWHHMKKTQAQNSCSRWQLAKANMKNIHLGELRDDLMLKRKMLTIEKSYFGVDWAFYKLAEAQAERKAKRKQLRLIPKRVEVEEPPTELANVFNIYLKKRLTAYQEARRRDARSKKLDLRFSSQSVPGSTLGEDEDEEDEFEFFDTEDEEDWEDMEDEEEEGEDSPWAGHKKRRKKKKNRKPKYYSDGDADENERSDSDDNDDDDDDDDDYADDDDDDVSETRSATSYPQRHSGQQQQQQQPTQEGRGSRSSKGERNAPPATAISRKSAPTEDD